MTDFIGIYMYIRAGIHVKAFEFIIIIDLFIWRSGTSFALCRLLVVVCGILATRSGIEPGSPELGAYRVPTTEPPGMSWPLGF